MKRLNLNQVKKEIDQIPQSIGIFICYSSANILFFKVTENLHRFIDLYLISDTDDINLHSLRESTEYIDYEESNDLFQCLIEEKLFFKEHKPHFNQIIKVWSDYSYLSIQWNEVPFTRISPDTLLDSIYIGPFRTQFFIQDIIDSFATIYKLPSCEDDSYPCYKMKDNLCAGYCVFDENSQLKDILISFLMTPNFQIIKDINQSIEQFEEDLDFNSSELLQIRRDLILSYYRQLLFLYTTRFINETIENNNATITVQKGIITQINLKNKEIQFSKEDLPRDNELLVVNKDELDERWIIFRYFEKNKPTLLKDLFQNNYHLIHQRILEFIN